MNIEQSKKLSIIDFLDKENVTLKKKKGNAYWYLSPFRDEKTASFKVSKKENLWYDYAIKEGGDLVELVKRMYNKQSVSDALAYLASKSIATVDKAIETAIAAKEYTTTKMNDVKLLPLSNHSLLSYFSSRRIDITIGRMYCREIHYKVEQKHYYGIAFGNRCAIPISRAASGIRTSPCLPIRSTSGKTVVWSLRASWTSLLI